MRPAERSGRKLKKGADDAALSRIEMVSNPDILATMGARKRPDQVVIGYAAETEDVEANARAKLLRKHADAIVGNLVAGGLGFAADENEVIIVTTEGARAYPLCGKDEIANIVLDFALHALQAVP